MLLRGPHIQKWIDWSKKGIDSKEVQALDNYQKIY